MTEHGVVIPKVAGRILLFFLNHEHPESIFGDYEEIYHSICNQRSVLSGRIWLYFQILAVIPSFLKNYFYFGGTMIKNHLKTTFRNIIKHKGYSIINILGLAMGIASSIVLLLHINYEFSYDRHHENTRRIYRITASGESGGEDYSNAKIPSAMAPVLLSEFPEIENVTRFIPDNINLFRYQDKKYYEPNFKFVDNSIFSVFSYSLIEGNKQTALKTSNSVVLSREKARKYFGNENPMGKFIRFNNQIDLAVTGIIEKPPSNSHLQSDILISYDTLNDYWPGAANTRDWANSYTYVLVKEGTNTDHFHSKLRSFLRRHMGGIIPSSQGKISCIAQPLTSIHLHSHLPNELPGNTHILYIYILIGIALLIILIASINYINLSTARFSTRAREVGLRKVLGARRRQIASQFFGESIFFVFMAFAAGLVLVKVSASFFSSISGYSIRLAFFGSPVLWIELFLVLVFVSLVAGIYPAFLLGRFNPIATLKSRLGDGLEQSKFRNILVVFQFSILIGLIIVTTAIFNQLDYMRSRNSTIEREQLLTMKIYEDHSENDRVLGLYTLKNEMKRLPGVLNATLSTQIPGTRFYQGQFVPEGSSKSQAIHMEMYDIDGNYLDTFGVETVEGRGFSRDLPDESAGAVMINRTAARRFGWEEPVGKRIYELNGSQRKEYHVIGVVEDFHSQSLHQKIEPMIIFSTSHFHFLTLRLNAENISGTMRMIREKWEKLEPHHPFDHFFLDDHFNDIYLKDVNMGKFVKMLTVIAIFIGCLGLFGLAAFTTEQRFKEIGIRKVLGSSVSGIVILLTKEITKWVMVANLLAWPMAYLTASKWLNNFAYREGLHWSMFLVSGGLALLLALLTVSYQSVKAARVNPAVSLKSE